MFQIKCNESTRVPGQHIIVQLVNPNPDSDSVDKVHTTKFDSVCVRRFRIYKGQVSRAISAAMNTTDAFWEWLYLQLNPKLGTWIWCDDLVRHAWLLGLPEQIDQGKLTHKNNCLVPRVGYWNLESKLGNCTWLDITNWLRYEVGQLKFESRIDNLSYTNGFDSMCSPLHKAFAVCETLANHVAKICKFVINNDLGVMKLTAAGQSLAAYRHKFGPKRTWTHTAKKGKNKGKQVTESRLWPRKHDNADVTRLERKSYHGGPTHCYYIGKVDSPVYVYDVRSIYPYVLKNNLYPCEITQHFSTDFASVSISEEYDLSSIASVRLECTDHSYPIRGKFGTYYARGNFSTVLAGPELSQALRYNEVKWVYELATYKMLDLFSPFVDSMYALRERYEKENDHTYADLCKLILNSLGSKFGQLTGQWRDDKDMPCESPWGYWHLVNKDGKVNLCRGIAGNTQVMNDVRTEAAHSFPAIPAFMCSYARVYMDQLIGIAKQAGHVYYSAVDSIHCDDMASTALACAGSIGSELGQLRLKGIFPNAEYHGIGDYELGGKYTRSGLALDAEPACQQCKESIYPSVCWCAICKIPWDGTTYTWIEKECGSEAIANGPTPEIIDRRVTMAVPHPSYKFGEIGIDGWVSPYTITPESYEPNTRQLLFDS